MCIRDRPVHRQRRHDRPRGWLPAGAPLAHVPRSRRVRQRQRGAGARPSLGRPPCRPVLTEPGPAPFGEESRPARSATLRRVMGRRPQPVFPRVTTADAPRLAAELFVEHIFGIPGEETLDLNAALDSSGPVVVDVPIDYAENVKLGIDLWQLAPEALT